MKKPERTPEEVKKGLMCCWKDGCADCPYDDDCEHSSSVYIARDALSYIQQLEQERDKAIVELAAALYDMKQAQSCVCNICKKHYRPDPEVRRYSCKEYGDAFAEMVCSEN